jgi:hypothetical protein
MLPSESEEVEDEVVIGELGCAEISPIVGLIREFLARADEKEFLQFFLSRRIDKPPGNRLVVLAVELEEPGTLGKDQDRGVVSGEFVLEDLAHLTLRD